MTTVIERLPIELVPGRPRVGKIYTDFIVRNHDDEGAVRRGTLAPAGIRELRLEEVLADSGADTLCLPADVIAQLGLPFSREVPVATATEIRTARIFSDAHVLLLGRQAIVECIELPAGFEPLLGAIPMEIMGVVLDLKKQELRLLPEDLTSTHIRA